MAYNESLQELHAQKRSETIKELRAAISLIESVEGENAIITAKKILENSSLSRPVLYKEHVLKEWNKTLWEKHHLYNTKTSIPFEQHQKDLKSFQERESDLSNKLLKAHRLIERLQIQLENEKKRNTVYQLDIEELKLEKQKLLSECQRLNDKLFMHGKV